MHFLWLNINLGKWSYDNFSLLIALLAVAEEEVVLYSPPLRKNTSAIGIGVGHGYYNVHGTSDEDLWHIVNQAITPDQYEDITSKAIEYCDLWCEFWDAQMNLKTQ